VLISTTIITSSSSCTRLPVVHRLRMVLFKGRWVIHLRSLLLSMVVRVVLLLLLE
jgi:hypothetical protein